MAKQKVTSKSSKRYRYSSFKDKIDDLRIEPARNLAKRVHDHVETSHFLASFEHWEDVNMSANFTSFSDDVRPLVQTLPQILFHEKQIFDLLHLQISKHDENSLQPLLDLLAQFCHDLGPDFMQFYEPSMKMLTDLLDDAINFESSNVFEWGFNCVAYIYKYLSRVLAQDLLPTFNLLFPLFSHRKEYLSRFSAEALSFLVRKAKQDSLRQFICHAFVQLRETPEEGIYDGLRTLFTETLISTKTSLHSKSNVIMEVLIQEALSGEDNLRCISLLADVILNVLRHASADAASSVYEVALAQIGLFVKDAEADLEKPAKLLISLTFAESGKKVQSWSDLISCVQSLLTHNNSGSLKPETIALLFCCILRNSPVPNLTQCHKPFFDFYFTHFPTHVLEFFKLALSVDRERFFSFSGSKYLQKYILSFWGPNKKKIALFLSEIEGSIQIKEKMAFTIPSEFTDSILKDICNLDYDGSEKSLFEIFWRLSILRSSSTDNFDVIAPVMEKLMQKPLLTDFEKDVLGEMLQVLTLKKHDPLMHVINLAVTNFGKFQDSRVAIEGLNRILGSVKDETISSKCTLGQQTLLDLAKNLSLPDDKIRYESLKLIITILSLNNAEVPQFLNELKTIEEIPRNLQTARNITMRIRKLGLEFSKMAPEELTSHIFFNYLFGILTVRFSPIWEGVYEILPSIFEKNQQLTWTLFLKFIGVLDNNKTPEYYGEATFANESKGYWSVSVSRLNDNLRACEQIFSSYHSLFTTLLDLSKNRRSDLVYPGLIRNQALKGLLLIPQLAERHSRDIVPFFLKTSFLEDDTLVTEDAEEKHHNASTWSEADRKLLFQLLGKFRNIKAIYKSDDVHQRFLDLLGSKTTDVQKLALDGILAYREKVVIKYRDNLRNLLDDNAFKDECIKLMSHTDSRVIESADEGLLMPIVLRILFGRAQTPVTSGLKKSRKTAVITLLPSLDERYVFEFLNLASDGLNYKKFFESGDYNPSTSTQTLLRRMAGFAILGQSAVKSLGSRYPQATSTLIDPTLYSSWVSNEISSKRGEEEHLTKQANNVRQASMKLLFNIFSTVGNLINWECIIPNLYKYVVQPRLTKFEDENLQQPSSLMNIITYWATDTRFYNLLYHDDCSAARALMKTLINPNAKESVVESILSFANQIIKNPTREDAYITLISLVASSSLKALPALLQKSKNPQVVAVSVDLLLNLVEAGYVQDSDTKRYLLNSLAHILEGEIKSIQNTEKAKVLQSIASLILDYECEWSDLEHLYVSCSRLYSIFTEKQLRQGLNAVFQSISTRFENLKIVSSLLADLNAYSTSRMETYDFERVLPAFKKVNDIYFKSFGELEWLPVMNSCLYYINDLEELAIRTNASHTLKRLIDSSNTKLSANEARPLVELIKNDLVPQLKNGLRHKNDEIKVEYISTIAYVVMNSVYYTELDDMKILLFNGDEEANFFTNVAHIQLHRRQRAIKRLGEVAAELAPNSIAHFLIPMIEQYVYCSDEKYRNIGNETISTIGLLSSFVTWSQYKALIRRFAAMLKQKTPFLKEIVTLIVACSKSLKQSLQAVRSDDAQEPTLRQFPKTLNDPEVFIKEEIYPNFKKVLNTRDEETIVARIPLCEATVNFILGLDMTDRGSLLPGVLSSVCQVLRSRSEELREAVRKNLASISVILGPDYLTFILKELRVALRRGSHIHILSYTVHSILMSLAQVLSHKDLDSNASLIVGIIMEDIFGAAGQEKESEGYTSKLKELKFNKSYDTGEILAANISLSAFGALLQPVKALLAENMGLKNQRKLNELMRRYALGINHNEESSSTDALALCYEIFTQSSEHESGAGRYQSFRKSRVREDAFFLVNLNAKEGRVQTETSTNNEILQKFAFDLLRTILSRNANLMESEYLESFIPLLQGALDSKDEGVLISALRVLILLVKLDFTEENEGVFKNCARKVLNVIKDSPSTSTELCQVSLKYLSSIIRHKDIQLKDTALSFIMDRIKPDLNEPNKQGLAFNFLRALLSKHIVLPEMYDIVDTVAQIMVTNHSKEIRDVSRSVYYQFLMEYDQSRGRLEKQFKFLVSNLEYPSQEGRQSVMELINLIVNKSNDELLMKLSASFFLALSNVAVNDSSPRCREMGSTLLRNLLIKLGKERVASVEKYILAWLKQESSTFIELGLRVYKIYLTALSMGCNDALDGVALTKAKKIIADSDVGSAAEWHLCYTALNVMDTYVDMGNDAFAELNTAMWNSVISCLLYPHPWVRLVSSRMVHKYVERIPSLTYKFPDLDLQNIANRIFRQLGAQSVTEPQAHLSVKTLVLIFTMWERDNTAFVAVNDEESTYDTAISFGLARIGSILRDEENAREMFFSKKACMQLYALIIQIMSEQQVRENAEKVILPLFTYLEDDRQRPDEQTQELQALAHETVEKLQSKLSVTDFTTAYSKVRQEVSRRRYERRAKRAVLAVTAPEAAARRKLKKHARSKEKRRHEKDENGYYHAKGKKRRL